MSLPVTWWPMATSAVAIALIPVPPTPTTWIRRGVDKSNSPTSVTSPRPPPTSGPDHAAAPEHATEPPRDRPNLLLCRLRSPARVLFGQGGNRERSVGMSKRSRRLAHGSQAPGVGQHPIKLGGETLGAELVVGDHGRRANRDEGL